MACSAGWPAAGGDAQRAQDGQRHVAGRGHVGQGHEGDAVRETGHGLVGQLQRQPAFADARRADDGEEADAVQPGQQLGHLAGPADQRQQRGRWTVQRRGGGDDGLAGKLDACLPCAGDGDLLIGARAAGQRQELLHQGRFLLLKQHGHKERGQDGQIGQARAVFQTRDLLAAVAHGPAHLVLGQAGALAQQAQRFGEGVRKRS
jgi:hypothetical protein